MGPHVEIVIVPDDQRFGAGKSEPCISISIFEQGARSDHLCIAYWRLAEASTFGCSNYCESLVGNTQERSTLFSCIISNLPSSQSDSFNVQPRQHESILYGLFLRIFKIRDSSLSAKSAKQSAHKKKMT